MHTTSRQMAASEFAAMVFRCQARRWAIDAGKMPQHQPAWMARAVRYAAAAAYLERRAAR